MSQNESDIAREELTAALAQVRAAIDVLDELLSELPEPRTPRGFGTLLGSPDDRR